MKLFNPQEYKPVENKLLIAVHDLLMFLLQLIPLLAKSWVTILQKSPQGTKSVNCQIGADEAKALKENNNKLQDFLAPDFNFTLAFPHIFSLFHLCCVHTLLGTKTHLHTHNEFKIIFSMTNSLLQFHKLQSIHYMLFW